MRTFVQHIQMLPVSLGAFALLIGALIVGCGTSEEPPVDMDMGMETPVGSCVPVQTECTPLGGTDCTAARGCEVAGTCSGQHDSCVALEVNECHQQGCFIWMGLLCDNVDVDRSCAGFSPNSCASIGCTLTVTGCESVASVCQYTPLDECDAAVGCELTCPSDHTACAGGCVPNAEAATDPTCATDCLGVVNGTAEEDACGVCDDNPSNDCEEDCAGVGGGTATLDDCGVCDTDSTNDCVRDCTGVLGGPNEEDSCGICDTNSVNDCIQDCNGVWGGHGEPDGENCSASAPTWCSAELGVWEYDHCWFLGDVGQSCTSVCSGAGLSYDEATLYVTGAGGNTSRCDHVLGVLGLDLVTRARMGYSAAEMAAGCAAHSAVEGMLSWGSLYYNGTTSAAAAVEDEARVCACD